jgi:hypothetical protein
MSDGTSLFRASGPKNERPLIAISRNRPDRHCAELHSSKCCASSAYLVGREMIRRDPATGLAVHL